MTAGFNATGKMFAQLKGSRLNGVGTISRTLSSNIWSKTTLTRGFVRHLRRLFLLKVRQCDSM